ncbi:MAG: hypothetical protein PVF27_02405 [Gemmatimonadales bacterium]|jgi:hypothetical protein
MGSSLTLVVLVAVLAAVFAWLVGRPGRRGRADGTTADEAIDRETLAEAESEIEGLDAFATPEDAEDELPDWGPGAPKP